MAGQKLKKNTSQKMKNRKVPTSVSKRDESYNTDKAPDTLASKEEYGDYRPDNENDRRNNLQNNPSANSLYNLSKVRNNY